MNANQTNVTAIQTLNNALKIPSAKKTAPKGAPKTTEVKAAKKKSIPDIPKCPEGFILVGHGKKEGVSAENARAVASVTPVEIVQAGKSFKGLAVNLLAGQLHPEIVKAYQEDKKEKDNKKANRLTQLLGGRENRGHIGFLRALMEFSSARLVKAWNTYVKDHKEKETYPSLSGIFKACEETGLIGDKKKLKGEQAEEEKKRTSFRDAFTTALKGRDVNDVRQVPLWLFDLLVEYKIIEMEEPETKH